MAATFRAPPFVQFTLASLGANDINLSSGDYLVDGQTHKTLDASHDGDKFSFHIWVTGVDEWESGSGVYTHAGTTLARTTVEESSTDAKVTFTGAVTVALNLSAAAWEELRAAVLALESAPPAHVHDASDITSGTLANAQVAQSNVTQHEAALAVTASQISDSTADGRAVLTSSDTNPFSDTQVSKLAGIETSAKDDQSAAEIVYSNTTSGLTAIDVQAAVDEVEARVDTVEAAPPAHAASHTDGSDDVGTAAGQAMLTAASAAAQRTLLNVENAAAADQSDAEIETAYGNQVPEATQIEIEAGTEVAVRRMSPLRISQAVDAPGVMTQKEMRNISFTVLTASGTTMTLDFSVASQYDVTVTADITSLAFSFFEKGAGSGTAMTVQLINSGIERSVVWDDVDDWIGGAAAVARANTTTIVELRSNGTIVTGNAGDIG